MVFVCFLLLLWGMALFYRAEHRAYIRELAALAPQLKAQGAAVLAGRDWRPVRQEGEVFVLKRAFQIKTRKDVLRYALPVLFFCAILFILREWSFAFFYAAIAAAKWFGTETRLRVSDPQGYEVWIAQHRLLAENFKG